MSDCVWPSLRAALDIDEQFQDLQASIENAQIEIGRAERLMRNGDIDAAYDILRAAAKALAEEVA